jgi:hypothetical protein
MARVEFEIALTRQIPTARNSHEQEMAVRALDFQQVDRPAESLISNGGSKLHGIVVYGGRTVAEPDAFGAQGKCRRSCALCAWPP